MDKELAHLRELNAQFNDVLKAVQHADALVDQMQRSAHNSAETLRLYSEIHEGAQLNEQLLRKDQQPALQTLDTELDASRQRVAALRAQLDRIQ